jgi:hypothetical protein
MFTRISVLVTLVVVCCTLLLSLVAFTGPALAASPSAVHVNPSSVTQDAAGCVSFTVTGNDSPAGDTIGIYFDEPVIDITTADSNRNFTRSEYVCGIDTLGRHFISAFISPVGGGAGAHLTVMT